jgi:hypothetical protein
MSGKESRDARRRRNRAARLRRLVYEVTWADVGGGSIPNG